MAGAGAAAFFSEGGSRINTGSVWGATRAFLVSGA